MSRPHGALTPGNRASLSGSDNSGVQVGQVTGDVNNYYGWREDNKERASVNAVLDELSLPFGLPAVTAVETFVGRDKELSEIQAAFTDGPEKRSIVVLYGLGGIGKTQTATKYAKDHSNDYLAVLWLNGNDADSLDQSFASVAQRLWDEHPDSSTLKTMCELPTPADIAKAMVRWLGRGSNRRWLLIFDNVDNPKLPSHPSGAYDLIQYIPPAGHGHIIVTTRLSELEVGTMIPVRHLSDVNESLKILASTSRRLNATTDPDAANLAQRLEGLPLALASAGALLRQTTISFAAYLQSYEKSWSKIQDISPNILSYRDRTLRTTWDISLERVKEINPDAAELLRLWACFDNNDLWFGLIQTGLSVAPELCELTIEEELEFHGAMKVLRDHCFAEPLPDSDGYGCHTCVHDWIRSTLHAEPDNEAQMFALLSVASSSPDTNEEKYWLVQRRLLPHSNRLMECTITSTSELRAIIVGSFRNIGVLYADQGKLEEAEIMYKRGLDEAEMLDGFDDEEERLIYNDLGRLYMKQDKVDEAEVMYQKALEGMMEGPDSDKEDALRTINNLGILYKKQGKIEEAETMYQRALYGYEKLYGPDHRWTLDTLSNLGVLYRSKGMLSEAEEMYQRALKGREKLFGPDHPATHSTVRNLGVLYSKQGKLDEAESMLGRTLAWRNEVWGPDHMKTLDAVSNVAHLYRRQGRLEEAEAMFQRAADGYQRTRGDAHRRTQSDQRNLARTRKQLRLSRQEESEGALSGIENLKVED